MNKKLTLAIILLNFVSVYSVTFNMQIEDELCVDIYQAEYDKLAVQKMMKDCYQIADDITLTAEQRERLQALQSFQQDQDFVVDLVLLYENKVVGCCCYDTDTEKLDGHLYMIMIDKAYRRKGFAEKFLLKLMDLHKFVGMKTMSLCAHSVTNSAAIKLYEKIGFEKVGVDLQTGLQIFSKIL